MNELEKYIRDDEHLNTVGAFDKYGHFEFSSIEVLEQEMKKFTPQQIKDQYLKDFNPVLHWELSTNSPTFTKDAFESLINFILR